MALTRPACNGRPFFRCLSESLGIIFSRLDLRFGVLGVLVLGVASHLPMDPRFFHFPTNQQPGFQGLNAQIGMRLLFQ